jgi:hypothetical protein
MYTEREKREENGWLLNMLADGQAFASDLNFFSSFNPTKITRNGKLSISYLHKFQI